MLNLGKTSLFLTVILCNLSCIFSQTGRERLIRLGRIQCPKHDVRGTLYVKDFKTLLIEDFVYDGYAPDAFFYVGGTDTVPNKDGIRIQYPPGSDAPLKKFNKERVEVKLPEGITFANLGWFSVWCRAFQVNFGEVMFNNLHRSC